MKILMLNHEFPPVGGGAAPVTFELCQNLVKTGHEVDVVTMHYGQLPRFETIEGVNIYRTPAIRKKPNICHTHEMATYFPGALLKTLKLAKQNKYDIIHCHFMIPGSPLALTVSKITKIPFLVTCHGSDVPGYNPDRFKLAHKIITPAWKLLVKSTPLITTPGVFLKELIEKNYPKANVTVVPNGIDTNFYQPAQKQKTILLCSRMFPRKGLQYVIEAVKEMSLDWQVNVIGQGPYLPELQKMAEDSKTPIKFWGWLDKNGSDFKNLFNTSSIFIFTSEAESFGMVIAEAMAAQNAIIASDIPAHKEVLGDAGLFVETKNPQQIRQQLQKLIDDENFRNDLAQKARQRVCEKFDWQVVTSEYVDCYKKVLENK